MRTTCKIIDANFRYEIMKRCWNFGSEDRPCFAKLVQDISQKLLEYQEHPAVEGNSNADYLSICS